MIFLFLLNIWLFKKSVYKEVVNSYFCTVISLMTKKRDKKSINMCIMNFSEHKAVQVAKLLQTSAVT